MSARHGALALLALAWIGAGVPATHSPAYSPVFGSPSRLDHIVVAGAAATRAAEPTLLTGTVVTAPAADSCAGRGARYLLVSRHGRDRLSTHRPRVEQLLARVAGKPISVTVAGRHAFDPACPRFEVEAVWLRQPRPQPLRAARRGT